MRKFLWVFTLVWIFISCDNDKMVFHEYKDLQGIWHKDSAAVFNVNNLDSINPYNVYITLRNDNDYAFSNLFVIGSIQFPNGKVISDTLEYEMARPDGSWLGEGFGDIKESKLWYKEKVRFNEAGTYIFKLRHAMRRNGDIAPMKILKGVRNVGILIENPIN